MPPNIELVPLIETPEPPPGSELSETTKPETCPCKILSTEPLLFFQAVQNLLEL